MSKIPGWNKKALFIQIFHSLSTPSQSQLPRVSHEQFWCHSVTIISLLLQDSTLLILFSRLGEGGSLCDNLTSPDQMTFSFSEVCIHPIFFFSFYFFFPGWYQHLPHQTLKSHPSHFLLPHVPIVSLVLQVYPLYISWIYFSPSNFIIINGFKSIIISNLGYCENI